MRKQVRILLCMVLAAVIVFSLLPGAAATEEEHEHDMVCQGSYNEQSHLFVCSICGTYQYADHTFDSAGICTVCGYQYVAHEHDWYCQGADEYWHTMVCSGCGETKTLSHEFDGEICSVCGFQFHEHIWQYSGESYAYNHGLRCTSCDATTIEDHTYGSDGTCTVCGNPPPHEHQWVWDGNKSNYVGIHFLVCSCGASTSEPHHDYTWDGKIGYDQGHNVLCGVCGFGLVFNHVYDSAYYNGERCTVCGYPGQPATAPETKPSETPPAETRPAETKPAETGPAETEPAGTQPSQSEPGETQPPESEPDETQPPESEPDETQPTESEPDETQPTESEPDETQPSESEPDETQPTETEPEDTAQADSQPGGTSGVWIAVIILSVGVLAAVLFLRKKK